MLRHVNAMIMMLPHLICQPVSFFLLCAMVLCFVMSCHVNDVTSPHIQLLSVWNPNLYFENIIGGGKGKNWTTWQLTTRGEAWVFERRLLKVSTVLSCPVMLYHGMSCKVMLCDDISFRHVIEIIMRGLKSRNWLTWQLTTKKKVQL